MFRPIPIISFAAFALFCVGSCPSIAQDAPSASYPDPDVVACLAAVDVLDSRYRAWMQMECLKAPLGICDSPAKRGTACLDRSIAAMREVYADIIPRLPAELGETDARRLDDVSRAFEVETNCADVGDAERALCTYSELAIQTIRLFDLSRSAGIPLPGVDVP